MSQEIETVSLSVAIELQVAQRLRSIATQQGLSLDAAVAAAIAEYTAMWEGHLEELDDGPREDLPWLKAPTD